MSETWTNVLPAVVAAGALLWAILRDTRKDVQKTLDRIENDVSQLRENVHAIDKRLVRIETKLNMKSEKPAQE